ncbi:hypothetical protein AMTR_s00002p00270380 [Amborella trichopoda]|uniref:DYW domain-containing protein n=2 Tax=Amborella trichopoda TaxID=13333 RepID=W1P3G6_AMBTC|nr:hypothetical protein AMTR_s00002p00270380 [Amborella trichopoda]
MNNSLRYSTTLLEPLKIPPLHVSSLSPETLKTNNSLQLKLPINELRLRESIQPFHQGLIPLTSDSYSTIIEFCADAKSITLGKQIHARLISSHGLSHAHDPFLCTKILFMYAKCGCIVEARKLFDLMPEKTTFIWNALIGGYASLGQGHEAVELFLDAWVMGGSIDSFTFPCVLKACGYLKALDMGEEIHGLLIKSGYLSFTSILNALMAMYAKCGELCSADKVFREMYECKDVVSWNTIISSYSRKGYSYEALEIFREMNREGVGINSFTVVSILQACSTESFLKLGMEIHAAMLKKWGEELGFHEANSLLVMYARSNLIKIAAKVFYRMKNRDKVSWNSMLCAYVQSGGYSEALRFFQELQHASQKPDLVSIITIGSAASRLGNLRQVKEIHCYALKNGFNGDLEAGNSLLDMYSKCGKMDNANRVFEKMPTKDVISWTAMISGYAQNSMHLKALEFFEEAQSEGIPIDSMIIGSLLLSCGGLESISYTKQVHSYVIRHFLLDRVLENSIVDAYGECGCMDYAICVFKMFVRKDLVTWTSAISGYVKNHLPNKGLELFRAMVLAGLEPDSVALVSILSASADLSVLRHGKEAHGYLIRKWFILDGSLSSSLIDMYSRCGSVGCSYKVFEAIQEKDLVSWTSMITANGMHGRGKEALELFERMRKMGPRPDHIAFLSLLYACSHSGLVKEGKTYLKMMKDDYGLDPWPDHHACIVDLLGRSDCLNEAYEFVMNMPIEPNSIVWCSLLGACRVHSDTKLGEHIAQNLLKSEPENPGNYVLVSNIFASSGKWSDVKDVREMMKKRGLKKNPGCSWIEVGNMVHSFMSGDKHHPKTEQIYEMLREVRESLEGAGYVAQTKFVLHDVGEREKVEMLHGHSERIAIAFGLLSTPKGTTIRVTKNLRVCGDCHNAIKLAAKIFGREIVVRDSNRFHHFKGGVCSCGDFW